MSHKFLMDSNLGLRPDEQPWHDLFAQADIEPISTNDLERADKIFADHVPDIAFMPSADVHRLIRRGDHYYRGLAISTSKFTGEPTMKVLLVVKKDDRPPAWMTWRKRNTATSTARAPRPTSHPQSS
jgi:phosphonate transport system substrate-binding protein